MGGSPGKYILGEAFASLGSKASKKSTPQKLLQLERTLCFLMAKCGVRSILDAVAAVFLFGPHLDPSTCVAMALTLQQCGSALPLISELSENGRCIALSTPHASYADANTFLLSLEVAGIKVDVAGIKADVADVKADVVALRTELRDGLAVLQDGLRTLLARP